MPEILVATFTSFWLGTLTSLSPCPLATNIAAISFISRNIDGTQKRSPLMAGFLYTIGRTVVYLLIGMLSVIGLMSVPSVSFFLQNYFNQILGPILIVSGMFLLEFFTFSVKGNFISSIAEKIQRTSVLGPLFLGSLFALAFCPVSAALFFGGMLPLSIKNNSAIILPSAFGLGTALPVVAFALIISFSFSSIGKAFAQVSRIERCARFSTGVLFIVIGIYYCLTSIYGLSF